MKIIFIILCLFFGLFYSETLYSQTKKTEVKKKSTLKKVKSESTVKDEYYHGHKVFTGPRGGRYYINSNGKKTYI